MTAKDEPKTYVDRPKPGPVPGSQVLVQRLDGVGSGKIPELLVHVVSSGSGIVTEPDTEVLDLERTLLVDLRKASNTRCMSDYHEPKHGFRSYRRLTTLIPTISPLAFLTFFNCLKKYQNLDLATTSLGAKILIL